MRAGVAARRAGEASHLTVFAYGQTGSGKTFTMGALMKAVRACVVDGVSAPRWRSFLSCTRRGWVAGADGHADGAGSCQWLGTRAAAELLRDLPRHAPRPPQW
jgi:hypothetical protein